MNIDIPEGGIPVGGFQVDNIRTLDPIVVDTSTVYPPEFRKYPVGGFQVDNIRTLDPIVVDTSNVYPPELRPRRDAE